MVSDNTPLRKSLLLKFVGIYILSMALVGFAFYSIFNNKSSTAVTSSNTRTLASDNGNNNHLFRQAILLNDQYKQLKALDHSYQNSVVNATTGADREQIARDVTNAEIAFNLKLDSTEREAVKNPVLTEKQFLISLSEAYRLVMNDRSDVKMFNTSIAGKGKGELDQQNILKWQSEIQVRNSRIAALESSIRVLENKSVGTPGTTKTVGTGQQEIESLKALLSTAEKNVANLSTANDALQKENVRLSALSNDQGKKTADNNTAVNALKTQNEQMQARIDQLNAEVRFAQVDCNFSRVDATQIVSNSKQRKNLLSDALGTLQNLSASNDPVVKRKAAEKITKLNQIASTIRD